MKRMSDRMANNCHIVCQLGLIILCTFLSGTSAEEVSHVFCSEGENVLLSCSGGFSDCTVITWSYKKHVNSGAVDLFTGGKKMNNIGRHERLSLGNDCSLNIYKATGEDYGLYNCRQNMNGHQYPDKLIYLHFLYVSPSSTQTEIRPDSSVTLFCQLFLYDGVLCDNLVRFEGIQLSWVNQSGVDLQTDSRYQISSGNCISTLTTKLLNEDNNREWRCLVIKANEVMVSASYTVKFGDRTSALIPVTTLNSAEQTSMPEGTISHKQQETLSTFVIVIIVVIAALAVVLLPAVFWMMCKKRADNRKEADDLAATDKNKYDGTSATINISVPPSPSTHEQQYDVIYCDVTTVSKKQAKKNNVHSDDSVTYAAIR